MSSINKATILGNVGKDPEIRSFPNGGRVASFSIATSESWKDKASGEKKERVTWHNISVLNENLVGIVEKYVKKGSKIHVEGAIETRKYTDKNGIERYATEIVLRPFKGEIVLLGKKDNAEQESDVVDQEQSFVADKSQADKMDDEIPF